MELTKAFISGNLNIKVFEFENRMPIFELWLFFA